MGHDQWPLVMKNQQKLKSHMDKIWGFQKKILKFLDFFEIFHNIRNVGRWKLCGKSAKILKFGSILMVLGPKNHEIQSLIRGYILGEIQEVFWL